MHETVFVKKKKKMAQQPFSDHFKARTFCVDDPQSFWNLKKFEMLWYKNLSVRIPFGNLKKFEILYHIILYHDTCVMVPKSRPFLEGRRFQTQGNLTREEILLKAGLLIAGSGIPATIRAFAPRRRVFLSRNSPDVVGNCAHNACFRGASAGCACRRGFIEPPNRRIMRRRISISPCGRGRKEGNGNKIERLSSSRALNIH